MFGEYNDESNTKVYALEYIIETLKANPAAIDNVEEFKKTMDTFEAPNPFMVGDAKLTYVGTSSFGQKRQVSVPLVVNEFKDGVPDAVRRPGRLRPDDGSSSLQGPGLLPGPGPAVFRKGPPTWNRSLPTACTLARNTP
jgi:hypothetical protein